MELNKLFELLTEVPQAQHWSEETLERKLGGIETLVKGTPFTEAVEKFCRSVREWWNSAPEELGVLMGYWSQDRDPVKIVLALGGPADGYGGLLWQHCAARPTHFVETNGQKFLLCWSEFQKTWFGVHEAAAATSMARATYAHEGMMPYEGPVTEIWHFAR